ncbi:hypothetical protein ACLOJK_018278 [Asimina triloba]
MPHELKAIGCMLTCYATQISVSHPGSNSTFGYFSSAFVRIHTSGLRTDRSVSATKIPNPNNKSQKPSPSLSLSLVFAASSFPAMAKSKTSKKRKLSKTPDEKPPIPLEEDPVDPYSSSSSSDSDSDSKAHPDKLHKLLEPYTKDQLIDFLVDAALADATLLRLIRSTADRDVAHRKIFVHGLGWDTTRDVLVSAFQSYGDIEDCNVVVDKVTGRAKGYGFVLFKTRRGAQKALKEPQKKINNRPAHCQLASVGPVPVGQQANDTAGRKIYVSNVHADVDKEKLRAFFSKFGEIETGPLGFDALTGKSRGFALFVYKTPEGAKKALEEPYRMFEGHQLHCQKATESSQKMKAAALTQQAPGPAALAAAAAAQNIALFTQNPTLNPALGALLANQNAGLSVTPLMAAVPAVNAGAGQLASLAGYGLSSLGSLGGSSSVLGAYNTQSSTTFPGQSSGGRTYTTGGSLGGLPPYVW